MDKRTALIVVSSILCFGVAIYFGLTVQQPHGSDVLGTPLPTITDWGRVALTLVFGAAGVIGLAIGLRKSG